MSGTIEADFPAGSPPMRGPSALNGGDLEEDPFAGTSERRSEQVAKRKSSSLFGSLITFCVGVAVTVAWYTYGGSARETIAGMSPQLAWMAPQPAPLAQSTADTPAAPTADQQLSAASPDMDAVRQNVDRIATTQDKIVKSIDQLSAGQEQLTKEIAKLQAVEQYILYKNSEPTAAATTRSAPAPAAPVRRPTTPLPPTPGTAPSLQGASAR
jgi:hypothetical protein